MGSELGGQENFGSSSVGDLAADAVSGLQAHEGRREPGQVTITF